MKTKNSNLLNLLVVWVIGFMFTSGMCAYYGLVVPLTARWYEIVQGALVEFILWPVTLGSIVASWH